jgi:magnesium chelatase family protein
MGRKPVTIGCGEIVGVDALAVTIEATMRGEIGAPRILGLVDTVVREAYHRVLSAFVAQGIPSPRGIPILNFVPAALRKTGSGFDLPMALALGGAGGHFPSKATLGLAARGEVSLEGRLLPVGGVVAVALAARERGWKVFLTSPEDAAAAAMVSGIDVYGVENLRQAFGWLRGEEALQPSRPQPAAPPEPVLDLMDIRDHQTPKTALLVGAAGRHNLLFVGPPGSGKSAMLQRLGGLLPPTSGEEYLEILKIHTAHHGGPGSCPGARPVRAPHHTSSTASLIGGGPEPRPGEVTLAHHGVLFLDEMAEFRRDALEAMRQPLEEGRITIGRARRTVTMPADFLLVGAMNPCPCGYLGHQARPCTCTPVQVQRYRARISGPLLDRLDLQVEVPAIAPCRFRQPPDTAWSTASLRARVIEAVNRQSRRNRVGGGWVPNGRLQGSLLERVVGSEDAVHRTVEEILTLQHLTGRARVRLLRIARTLADLDWRDDIQPDHILEAARLRGFAQRPPF